MTFREDDQWLALFETLFHQPEGLPCSLRGRMTQRDIAHPSDDSAVKRPPEMFVELHPRNRARQNRSHDERVEKVHVGRHCDECAGLAPREFPVRDYADAEHSQKSPAPHLYHPKEPLGSEYEPAEQNPRRTHDEDDPPAEPTKKRGKESHV
jgi:hypothetical protein